KELKVDGQLKDGDHLMLVNMSSPVQWDVLNEKGALSAIKGDVSIQDTKDPAKTFEFPLIGSLHADLVKDELSSDINAVLNGAPLNFNLKAANLSDPKLRFALQADMLDLDKLFPAPKPPAEPAQDAETPDAQGKAEQAQTSEQKASSAPPAPINLSLLDDIDVDGTVKLGGLKVRGLAVNDFGMTVVAREGRLGISKISAALYDGSLSGTFTANSRNEIAGKFNLSQVALGPLMRAASGSDRISGKGNAVIDLKSQGITSATLKSNLSGTANMQLREGAVRGIDLN